MADAHVRPSVSLQARVMDAAIGAAIAAVLALPLLGFRLADSPQGLSLQYRLSWVACAAAAVFAGRLMLQSAIALFTTGTRIPVPSWVRTNDATKRLGVFAAIAFAVLLPFLPFADRNLIDLGTLILIYVMLATGLNITVGLAGLLDLGYVAFYAAGAYSYALLSQRLGLSFWEALPVASLIAAGFGLLVGFPVLRLKGDYLAIVTLGFGQIARVILINWTEVTGGPNGIAGIERPSFFGLPFAASAEGRTFAQFFGVPFSPMQRIDFLYYLVLVMVILGALFVQRLRRLPLGRALEALREDETACVSLGLNPTAIKLCAFALGASFAGLAGTVFAARQGFISPESFTFVESALILAIVVLGGMGSQVGIVIAAILLVGLPEWFRDLAQYRMVAFGAAMVAIMLWRPKGLTADRKPTLRLGGGSR